MSSKIRTPDFQSGNGGLETDPTAPFIQSTLLDDGQACVYTAKDLKLVLVQTKKQNSMFKELITAYHSYVKSLQLPGRRLDYLILLPNGKPVGGIGLGNAPMFSRVMLDYFEPFKNTIPHRPAKSGNTGKSRMWHLQIMFNPFVAGNWKFTLTPDAPKNSGSRVLGIFVQVAKKDWKRLYGDELMWIITFIGAGKQGTIYKAAGWKYLGETKGETLKGRNPENHLKSRPMNRVPGQEGKYHMGTDGWLPGGQNEKFGGEQAVRLKVDKKLIFVKDLR